MDYKYDENGVVTIRGSIIVNIFARDDKIVEVNMQNSNIKAIPPSCFENCTNIVKVILYDFVEILGEKCFSGCTKLQTINLPPTIKTIANYAFFKCQSINMSIKDLPQLSELGNYSFLETGISSFSFSPFITVVKSYTFYSCQKLATISNYNNIIEIGDAAFSNCQILSYTPHSNLLQLGNSAFSSCKNITSFTVPPNINAIPSYLFYYCSNFKTLTLHSDVISIESYAFFRTKISSIVFPENLQSIGDYAF